jgi:hypothetical protein
MTTQLSPSRNSRAGLEKSYKQSSPTRPDSEVLNRADHTP